MPSSRWLWRFRWEGWSIRPYAQYFAPLCRTFRPGMRLLRVDGLPAHGRELPRIAAMAAGSPRKLALAVVNRGARAERITVQLPRAARGRMLRVGPDRLPVPADAFLDDWSPTGSESAALPLRVAPNELVVWEAE
jgi:hypothetical protein